MAERIPKVKRPWIQERKPFERERRHNDFDYNCRRWRKLRKHQLDLFPLCKNCEEKGLASMAKVADHIVPVRKGGEGFELSNLQSLCTECHNRKSALDK